jgi:hypothetical protein
LQPLGGERGGDGGLASVFGEVGDGATERDGTEGLGILAVLVDVLCIEGKEGVGWGIVSAPQKGLHPRIRILLREPRKLEMLRGGERLSLHVEHGGGEREDKDSGYRCKRGAERFGVKAMEKFES